MIDIRSFIRGNRRLVSGLGLLLIVGGMIFNSLLTMKK